LFLYTSNFDGLPNVLIEAAAAGLPIVSSDVGGIRELLGDGAGALVPNDPKAFVSAVRKLLLDPDRLDQQVLLSQQRIDTNHDPDQCRDRAYEAPSFLT
jgi:glycosyltransferase involved in cell wall biosynthesis